MGELRRERNETHLTSAATMGEKGAKAGGFREKVKHLTTQEIASLDPKTYVLVDVRPDELRKVSHIPGSITQAEFEQERDGNAGAYDGKTVITSCTIGYKSGLFAKELAAKCPSLEVRNHVGSIMDWCHEGKDLVDEKGKKNKKGPRVWERLCALLSTQQRA